MNVLISGAGIAGPTLAYWLTQCGVEATIVEQAPTLRTGGYIIDFWGAGFEVANRMGLLREIHKLGYMFQEVRAVSQSGRPVASFPAMAFASATGGAFTSLPRGDLAATLFAAIAGRVETIFGDSVVRIEQTEWAVNVEFERSSSRSFDLVVGADGLHSRIRELVFGAESRFERYLGLKVAAFEAEGYRPRDELVYVMYTRVGQQVSRFAMRNDRTMFLFIFADQDQTLPRSVDAQKSILRDRFGRSGWECPQILDALDSARELYFDRVSQIRMNPEESLWTKNRVTLVGDAAFCVSLLGGQGSALAMAAAYILAGELRRANGDHGRAFARYQQLFGPFVVKKQHAARRIAGAFAPKSSLALFLRNQLFQLLSVRWVANAIVAGGFRDKIELPQY